MRHTQGNKRLAHRHTRTLRHLFKSSACARAKTAQRWHHVLHLRTVCLKDQLPVPFIQCAYKNADFPEFLTHSAASRFLSQNPPCACPHSATSSSSCVARSRSESISFTASALNKLSSSASSSSSSSPTASLPASAAHAASIFSGCFFWIIKCS